MMITDAKETCAQLPRSERIAQLNDLLRKSATGGVIMITRGVRGLKGFSPFELMAALSAYDGFDADNDPHGERDFGDLEIFGADLLWKIDYYDKNVLYGSDDPADLDKTTRVLTILLAEEY
jgi:hypothetical protein